mgnify:CR=1 FL=1
MVGERIELKRRLDVKTSQARMSAHMVAGDAGGHVRGAGFAFGRLSPRSCDAGWCGRVVLGLALNVVALVVIRRIMRVEL